MQRTALQRPIYFTYEGEIVDDLRKKAETEAETDMEANTGAEVWANLT